MAPITTIPKKRRTSYCWMLSDDYKEEYKYLYSLYEEESKWLEAFHQAYYFRNTKAAVRIGMPRMMLRVSYKLVS